MNTLLNEPQNDVNEDEASGISRQIHTDSVANGATAESS